MFVWFDFENSLCFFLAARLNLEKKVKLQIDIYSISFQVSWWSLHPRDFSNTTYLCPDIVSLIYGEKSNLTQISLLVIRRTCCEKIRILESIRPSKRVRDFKNSDFPVSNDNFSAGLQYGQRIMAKIVEWKFTTPPCFNFHWQRYL